MSKRTHTAELLPEELETWAATYNIGQDAMHALQAILTAPIGSHDMGEYEKNSETFVQNALRVTASSREHTYLWRNNVGAVLTPSGQLRYGLCNESKKINQRFKSSDLIGITPITVTPEMVGLRLGVFTAIEVKKAQWKPGEDTQRERAQLRYINTCRAAGAFAFFCNDVLHYQQLLDYWKVPHVTDRPKRTHQPSRSPDALGRKTRP